MESVILSLTTDHAMSTYHAQLTVLWVLGVISLLALQLAELDFKFAEDQLLSPLQTEELNAQQPKRPRLVTLDLAQLIVSWEIGVIGVFAPNLVELEKLQEHDLLLLPQLTEEKIVW